MKKSLYGSDFYPVFLAFVALYFLEIFIFWPGLLRPDSLVQLSQAQGGTFSDHHPPLMALYWRGLNSLYPGPGLLFLTHLTLLFGAAMLFSWIFRKSLWRWFYLVILLWPQICFYSTFVLKDIGFTFSFLFSASVLSFYSVREENMPSSIAWGIGLLLFYGTAVKYQAVFVLPVAALWLAYCLHKSASSLKIMTRGVVLFFLLLGSVQGFNSLMTQTKDHSWQCVKLYDLVGIGLQEKRDLLPEFVKNEASFSPKALKEKFDSERVDSLVFGESPLLLKGKTEEERQALWTTWFRAVLQYPKAYLFHRGTLFWHLLNKSPIKGLSTIASHAECIAPRVKKILIVAESLGLVAFCEAISSFKFYLLGMIAYFIVGLSFIRKTPYAIPLAFLNGMGLALLTSLFIFSMASDARYIYLTVCCFHFSHPFFFKTLQSRKGGTS